MRLLIVRMLWAAMILTSTDIVFYHQLWLFHLAVTLATALEEDEDEEEDKEEDEEDKD